MNLSNVEFPEAFPSEYNVVVEIPANSDGIKYEFDKDIGGIVVDRFLYTSMNYPCNYGFIPNTLAGDGDPVDVLVHARASILPGSVIKCRSVGVLMTEDESGVDAKVLAVPVSKLDPYFDNILSYEELPTILLKKIEHFFTTYKDLEEGKWVKVDTWYGVDEAARIIERARR